MIGKLVVVLALASLAAAKPQAPQYPAGVHPSLCPNYPHCDNALLGAAAAAAAAPGAYAPQAYAPQAYAPAPVYAPAVPSHPGIPAAAQLPAGVSPHECPNYPYCTGHIGGGVAAAPPLPGFSERQYPDGVNPHSCPNYPYCH